MFRVRGPTGPPFHLPATWASGICCRVVNHRLRVESSTCLRRTEKEDCQRCEPLVDGLLCLMRCNRVFLFPCSLSNATLTLICSVTLPSFFFPFLLHPFLFLCRLPVHCACLRAVARKKNRPHHVLPLEAKLPVVCPQSTTAPAQTLSRLGGFQISTFHNFQCNLALPLLRAKLCGTRGRRRNRYQSGTHLEHRITARSLSPLHLFSRGKHCGHALHFPHAPRATECIANQHCFTTISSAAKGLLCAVERPARESCGSFAANARINAIGDASNHSHGTASPRFRARRHVHTNSCCCGACGHVAAGCCWAAAC